MFGRPINKAKREGEIRQFEQVQADLSMPYTCIDCGWKGQKNQLGGFLGFAVGGHFCPKCGEAEFLISGDELDEMNREDSECRLPHPLSNPLSN